MKPLLGRTRYEKSRGVVGEGKSRREERDFERPWMGTTRVETFTRMAEQKQVREPCLLRTFPIT